MTCAHVTFVGKTKTHYIVETAERTEKRLARRFKFTKAAVEALPMMGDDSQLLFIDSELPGFWLLVGKTVKTYYVGCDLDGTSRQRKVGRSTLYTAEEARKEARGLQQQMSKGVDPREEKLRRIKKAQTKKVTVRWALEEYLKRPLKASTRQEYRQVAEKCFGAWMNRPASEITIDDVRQRHTEIKERVVKRWKRLGRLNKLKMPGCFADYGMKILGSVLDHANVLHPGLVSVNTVKLLSQTKAYCKSERRETFIDEPDLPNFLTALDTVRQSEHPPAAPVVADYVEFLLFTGLRRNEAATLRWKQIDFDRKIVTIKETKNNLLHALPLTDHLVKILERQQEIADVLGRRWVFCSTGPNPGRGHVAYPEPVMELISKVSGVQFCLHDLRRTFITTCRRLKVTEYDWKRLLNHSMGGDVTYGYVMANVEDLREPMEQVTGYFLGMRAKGQGLKIAGA